MYFLPNTREIKKSESSIHFFSFILDVRFEVRESDFDFYIQTIFRSTNAREVYRDGRNGVHCTGGPVRKGGKLEQDQVQGPGGAAHGGPGNGKEEGRNFIGTLGFFLNGKG